MNWSFIILYVLSLANFTSCMYIRRQQSCSSISIRKEVRELSDSEWQEVVKAVNIMDKYGWFHWFAFTHVHFFNEIHLFPEFLPWHRRFIQEFESVAQHYCPTFALPYFDPTLDFADPAKSALFTSKYMGGDGGPKSQCVNDGPQANWQMTYPNNHCLKREFTFTDDPSNSIFWISPEVLLSGMQTSTDYRTFQTTIELGIHAIIHTTIGGDMVEMYSPNDFFFFLHHANIDRLWSEWQNLDSSYLLQYINDPGKPPVSLSDTLTGFPDLVGDLMVLGQNQNCFAYSAQQSISSKRSSSDSSITNTSITKALSPNSLKKYFPKLDPNNPNSFPIKLPKPLKDNSEFISSLTPSTANLQPIQPISGFSNSTDSPVANSISPSTLAIISTTPDELSMPYPARLPDSFISMHGISIDKYNALYSQMTGLIDTLNDQGYVSPYI
ncbi:Tyrosinase [Smittium culicis]|uniref:Tyrosinase n=1 Tax=Smittium culicis TaxID=133412 RepID=A0A1R1YED9_9FUNG|nr:Tyrosinase [Smittium culicis]